MASVASVTSMEVTDGVQVPSRLKRFSRTVTPLIDLSFVYLESRARPVRLLVRADLTLILDHRPVRASPIALASTSTAPGYRQNSLAVILPLPSAIFDSPSPLVPPLQIARDSDSEPGGLAHVDLCVPPTRQPWITRALQLHTIQRPAAYRTTYREPACRPEKEAKALSEARPCWTRGPFP